MKTQHLLGLLAAGLALGGCFNLPISSKALLQDSSGMSNVTQAAVNNSVSETKAIATIDPNSKVSVALTAPKVQGLSGASVVIPPGSLGISADIVVEQATDFGETSMTNEMGLANDIQVASASPGMIIRPTENVDLKKPLSLAMPLPVAAGLRLADTSGSKYAIFYKYFDPTQAQLVTGFKVVDGVNVKLAIDDGTGRDVIKFDGYFGAYWATILSREVKPAEVPPAVPASEPIVNKANVPVVETKGIVKETDVVQKQAIPEIKFDKPSLVFNADTRSVKASAVVPAGRTVSGCKVDLYEATTLPAGISLEVPLGPSVEYKIVKTVAHSLVARFRCTDDQGRIAVTPWSEAVTIPAVQVATASASKYGVCASPQAPLEIRTLVNGVLTPLTDGDGGFKALGNCRYSLDVYINNGSNDRFFVSRGDSSFVCGIPNHSMIEGDQKIVCQAATAANPGSNFVNTIAGNYTMTLDFSASETNPNFNLTKIPCANGPGQLYMQFAYSGTSPTFPAVGSTNSYPMTHLGACEYAFNATASPFLGTDGGVMRITNTASTYQCGAYDSVGQGIAGVGVGSGGNANVGSGGNLVYPGQYITNTCGSSFRYFKFKESPVSGVNAYRFSLKTGPALAKDGPGTSGAIDAVRYSYSTNCPDSLKLVSAAVTANPSITQEVSRTGGCHYDIPLVVDNPANSGFKVQNHDGTLICGATTSTASRGWAATCNATALNTTLDPTLPSGVYKVGVDGDPVAGINSLSITPSPFTCAPGLYISNSIAPGYTSDMPSAFTETDACVFEKIWTPGTGNLGFYVHSGQQNTVCGASPNSTGQPSLNGAAISMQCSYGLDGSGATLSKIMPLGVVAGTPYRVKVDMRLGNPIFKVEAYSTSTNCTNNLNLSIEGFVSNESMVQGNGCLYSLDKVATSNIISQPTTLQLDGMMCVRMSEATTWDMSAPGDSRLRSVQYDCSGSSGQSSPLFTGVGIGQSMRFYAKVDAPNQKVTITAQNMSYNANTFKLVVPSGTMLTTLSTDDNMGNFMWGNSDPSAGSTHTVLWSVSAENSFAVRINNVSDPLPNYCGIASGFTLVPNNSEVNLSCNYGQTNFASVPYFANGYASGTKYNLDFYVPSTYESPIRVKMNPTRQFTSGLNYQLLSGGSQTPGEWDTNTRPTGHEGSVTWHDSSGNIWLFGGRIANSSGQLKMGNQLWKYSTGSQSWTLINGSAGVVDVLNSASGPSSRAYSQTWYDANTNRLYLFGGQGCDSGGCGGGGYDYLPMNDFWYFDIGSLTWTMVNGEMSWGNHATVYNTLTNNPDPSNNPGARQSAVTWSNGTRHYLFGGRYLAAGSSVTYNDLWYFDSMSNNWAILQGPAESQIPATTNYPSYRYSAAVWEQMSSDPQGVYVFGGVKDYSNPSQELWRFNLSNDTWSLISGNDMTMSTNANAIFNKVYHPLNYPPSSFETVAIGAQSNELFLKVGGMIWAFNTALNQWASLIESSDPHYTGLPADNMSGTMYGFPYSIGRRQGASSLSLAGQGWYSGGFDAGLGPASVQNDIFSFNLPMSN